MTIARFTTYIRYSTACPDGITPARWGGMLKWARTHGLLITRVDRIVYLYGVPANPAP